MVWWNSNRVYLDFGCRCKCGAIHSAEISKSDVQHQLKSLTSRSSTILTSRSVEAMAAKWLLLAVLSHSDALILKNCTGLILPVSPAEAYQAAVRGGQYIANHIQDDGSFDYKYYPDRDEISMHDYAWTRHSGAVYALFELYQREKDELMLSRGKLALEFLSKRIVPCKPSGMCMRESGSSGSIGGSGLCLMALAAYQRATEDKTYLERMHQLASWILTQQREDGSFQDHNVDIKTGELEDHRNPYGLAEALLALMQLYKTEADKKYLNAATKGLHALMDPDTDTAAMSHWLGPTLRLAYDFTPDQLYVDYAMRILHGLKSSLSTPFCGVSTEDCMMPNAAACRTDGTTALWALLQASHNANASLVLKTLEPFLSYVMQSHISSAKAERFRNPALALGGLMSADIKRRVRIDDVQHASTALLAYAETAKLLGRGCW